MRPTMLTLALTGTVPETVDPEAGDVIVTIRLPRPSCAWAWVETNAKLESTSSPATRARVPIFNMDCSFFWSCLPPSAA